MQQPYGRRIEEDDFTPYSLVHAIPPESTLETFEKETEQRRLQQLWQDNAVPG
jgi:hypothetical protein